MTPISTLLLVDDNRELRSSLAEMLRGYGYPVIEAGSAAEALSLVTPEAGVRVVVTDLDMPGGSGLDLLDHLRRDDPAIRGLVITSRSDDPRLLGRRRSHALAVLAKPFAGEELRRAVERLAAAVELEPAETPSAPATAVPEGPAASGVGGSRARWLVGVALALLVALLVVLSWSRPPALPTPHLAGSSRRSSAVEVVAPRGQLTESPRELRWLPSAGAHRYLVEIRAVDDRVLWTHSTASTSVTLVTPDRILESGVSYFLRISAIDEAGTMIASSGRVRFQLPPPPPPKE